MVELKGRRSDEFLDIEEVAAPRGPSGEGVADRQAGMLERGGDGDDFDAGGGLGDPGREGTAERGGKAGARDPKGGGLGKIRVLDIGALEGSEREEVAGGVGGRANERFDDLQAFGADALGGGKKDDLAAPGAEVEEVVGGGDPGAIEELGGGRQGDLAVHKGITEGLALFEREGEKGVVGMLAQRPVPETKDRREERRATEKEEGGIEGEKEGQIQRMEETEGELFEEGGRRDRRGFHQGPPWEWRGPRLEEVEGSGGGRADRSLRGRSS